MSGDVLLDTNIVIAFFADDPAVVNQVQTASFFLCATVVGELYAGAYKSGRVAANIARVDAVVAASTILSCDVLTAKLYGSIKQELRTKGRPIPENDIWIAALAQQYALKLITRDEHFQHVSGLTTEKW